MITSFSKAFPSANTLMLRLAASSTPCGNSPPSFRRRPSGISTKSRGKTRRSNDILSKSCGRDGVSAERRHEMKFGSDLEKFLHQFFYRRGFDFRERLAAILRHREKIFRNLR